MMDYCWKQDAIEHARQCDPEESCGIIGIKNNKEIQQMKAADQVLSTLAINPSGAVVSSNAFADTDVNREFQRNLLGAVATDNRF